MEKLLGYLSVSSLTVSSILFLFWLNINFLLYVAFSLFFLGLIIGIIALIIGLYKNKGTVRLWYASFLVMVSILIIATLIIILYNIYVLL